MPRARALSEVAVPRQMFSLQKFATEEIPVLCGKFPLETYLNIQMKYENCNFDMYVICS